MSKYDDFMVSQTVHEKTVELPDGKKHVLFFKEMPVVEYRKFQMAEQSADEDVRAGSMAKLIAASLCEADGSPAMTYEQALRLKSAPANALFNAVISLNGIGDKEKKASPPGETAGSGTSSPSPSAAEQ